MYALKPYNTFQIDVKAKDLIAVFSVEELKNVLKKYQDQEIFVLGEGSNILLTQDIDKAVVRIAFKGIKIVNQDEDYVWVEAMAGENWHEFVLWNLERNFGGIENLSLIPGTVGAAPIQNIGAYGVELKDVFESCEAINIKTLKVKTFTKKKCHFRYRESIFKGKEKENYIILSVRLKLTKKTHRLQTWYNGIDEELRKKGITTPTIKQIGQAVVSIRKNKLPDPKKMGNSGSFFKNPIVPKAVFEDTKRNYLDMPFFVISDTKYKIPAAWLIEKAGFKGKRVGNVGVHQKQALVLINYGNATGREIYDFGQSIQQAVFEKFGIKIEMEVNVV